MPITPVNRHETFLAAAANGDTSLSPRNREEVLLQEIANAVAQGGGGITVDTEFDETSTNPITNATITNALFAIGDIVMAKPDAPTVVNVEGSTASISAEDNHIYKCGQLSSLTISSSPPNGSYIIVFASGSTATTFSAPSGLTMPDVFSVEANKRYEINVSDGYAVVASWTEVGK